MAKKNWEAILPTKFHKDADPLTTILTSYGINDIPRFLNPTKAEVHDPFLLRNMKEAVELFAGALGKRVFIKVDPDADGFTSATYMRLFIQQIAPDTQIDYALDFKKRHGLRYEDVGSEQYDLIIVPDASGEVEDFEKITSPILVLDHHAIDNPSLLNHCLMVNCQDGQYPNPNLTGVGVVQKFVEAYVKQHNLSEEIASQYLDLVAVGMVADMEDMTVLENRYYVLEGIKNVRNALLKAIIDLLVEDMPHKHYNMEGISWRVAPLINGLTRFGKEQEQIDFYRAFCLEEDTQLYKPRKSKNNPEPVPYMETMQARMARVGKNAKNRQDVVVREAMNELRPKIDLMDLSTNKLLIVDIGEATTKGNISGLIANKIASEYRRPTLAVKSYGSTLSGSGRTIKGMEELKSLLQNVGFVERAQGHEGAFGVTVETNQIPFLLEACNETMPDSILDGKIEVSYEVHADMLTEQDIREIAQHSDVWGSKACAEPTFGIKGIHISAEEISAHGKSNGFIRFTYNGVKYVKKYCKATEYDELVLTELCPFFNDNDLYIEVIAQAQENEWEGNISYEMKILHFWSKLWNSNTDEDGVEEERVERVSTVVQPKKEAGSMDWLFG